MNKILIGSDNIELSKQVIDILVKDENLNKENEVIVMSDSMVNANILAMQIHNAKEDKKEEFEKYLDEGKEDALQLAIIVAEQVGENKDTNVQKVYKKMKWTFEETKRKIHQLETFGYIIRDEIYENNIRIVIDPTLKIQHLQKQYLKARLISNQIYDDIKLYYEKHLKDVDSTKLMTDEELGIKPIIIIPEVLKSIVKDEDELLLVLNTLKDSNLDKSFIFTNTNLLNG